MQALDAQQLGTDRGKSNVWHSIALDAPDQLRQRVAWALAQIFVSNVGSLRATEA